MEQDMDGNAALRAIEDIKQLKARYFQHIDFKEWDEYAGLFTDDLVVYGEDDQVTTRGGATFAANVRAFLETSVTIHQGYLPQIEILGPAAARGLWAMHDIITWENGAPNGLRRMIGWGHYHETYRKEAGGWRIASMKLTRLRIETE
jgi:hypothetical protein